jgi:hypothetical protein
MPQIMLIVSSLSLWRHEFNPKPVHVIFVVDKVALEEVSVPGLQFVPVSSISSMLYTHLHLNISVTRRTNR